MNESDIRRGAASEPPEADSFLVRWANCPDCNGRGWYLHNPFATGGGDGSGGLHNKRFCMTCADAKKFYDEHGTEPDVAKLVSEAKPLPEAER